MQTFLQNAGRSADRGPLARYSGIAHHAGVTRARPLERILVVDDDRALQRALRRILAFTGAEIRASSTIAEAIAELADFDPQLVLLDVRLPDGSGLDVLSALQKATPRPTVVAMSGVAGPAQSFDLARLGARAYLRKPLDPDALLATIEQVSSEAPTLAPTLKDQVGLRTLRELEAEVRRTLIDEALARNHDSRSAAARELGISRQVLQHFLRTR